MPKKTLPGYLKHKTSGQAFCLIHGKFVYLEVTAWALECNTQQKGVQWQFATTDARTKLESLYPKFLY